MKKIALIIISFYLLSSCKENSKIFVKTKKCNCYDGIGSSKNDEPKLTYTFENNKSVSICGFVDKEMEQNQGIIISEFNVFDCDNGKSYVEYGALKICRIVEKQNELEIQDLEYLPIGKDWNWELIQIGEQTIKPNGKELNISELTPKTPNYTIEKKQTESFLNSLTPGKGFNSDWEQIIGKLEALSIIGNEKAWNILNNLESYTGLKFDGHLAETWKDSVSKVKWIRKL